MHEKDVLNDANVPAALEKLFKTIGTLRDSLSVNGFETGRMAQSYNYFGFTIEHEGTSIWFGYSLPTWATLNAPVCLQLREKWIKVEKEPVVSAAKELGFRRDEKLEWVLPFPVTEIAGWDNRLRDTLVRIAAILHDPNAQQG